MENMTAVNNQVLCFQNLVGLLQGKSNKCRFSVKM